MSETSMKRHMGLRASRTLANTLIYILLIAISIIWLIPFFCIVLQSFRVESTWQVGYVAPKVWGLDNYQKLFATDFPRWYMNTFIISVFTALLQTVIVLCMSYTLSRFRFKMRKPLMRFMLILGMFPGMLTMIILYRVLKDLGLTQANAVPGLILVYVASSGMGYYVSKGFFDTIPKSLDEAARVGQGQRGEDALRCDGALVFVLVLAIATHQVGVHRRDEVFLGFTARHQRALAVELLAVTVHQLLYCFKHFPTIDFPKFSC